MQICAVSEEELKSVRKLNFLITMIKKYTETVKWTFALGNYF